MICIPAFQQMQVFDQAQVHGDNYKKPKEEIKINTDFSLFIKLNYTVKNS